MSAAVLAIEALTVHRGGRAVLTDVSVEVPAGCVQAVIGANGSGKTTLVQAAAGLLPPTRGAVLVGGSPVAALPLPERARRIGYVPQRSALTAPLPVAAVVAMGRYHRDGGAWPAVSAATRSAVAAALAEVDALALAGRPFTALSGGEAQRVLIARALATGASLLVLDEPTASLDVGHRLQLLAVVRRLARQGTAVLIALHELGECLAVADAVLLLHEGRTLARGAPDAVIAPAPVRAAYGVELGHDGLSFRLPS